MISSVTLLGFGEAGQAFALGGGWGNAARVFDVKTNEPGARAAMLSAYELAGVTGCMDISTAIKNAPVVISLVTADQALAVAEMAAMQLNSDTLFFDMNSVAPRSKCKAADLVDAAGGRYVDVAVMAPVYPQQLAVPLLVSGPHATAGAVALRGLGFSNLHVLAGDVGRASSIKMIRSVMVKGIEALTAEMMLAAHEADVVSEVLNSLGADWADKANYNLDRMIVHGTRRAAEMEEVIKTLESLGVDPVMTGGTVQRQRWFGSHAIHSPPSGLTEKLEAIMENRKADAA